MASNLGGLSFIVGTNSTNASGTVNSVVKSAGGATNTAFQAVTVGGTVFDGQGDSLQDFMVATSGETAYAAIAGSGLIPGSTRDINKFEDVAAASIPTDAIHDRLTDTAIASSGYTWTIDARWVDPDGNFVNPTGSVTVDLEILDGSGDYAQRDARRFQPMYHYNIGGTPVKKYLPLTTS